MRADFRFSGADVNSLYKDKRFGQGCEALASQPALPFPFPWVYHYSHISTYMLKLRDVFIFLLTSYLIYVLINHV